MIYKISKLDTNSNTTLVKVKWRVMVLFLVVILNSNTTLVKVKLYLTMQVVMYITNSNTTLVKVKCGSNGLGVYVSKRFKYNTC